MEENKVGRGTESAGDGDTIGTGWPESVSLRRCHWSPDLKEVTVSAKA